MPIKVRLFFELPEDFDELKAIAVRVYECATPGETGVIRDTVTLKAGLDYIDATVNDQYSWFKLALISLEGVELTEPSEPILCEVASQKLALIRAAIKDTGNEPAFSDDELIQKMRLAAARLNGTKNLSIIPDRYWPLIELLVRLDICHVLAFDYAKYQKLEIPGGASLSRDELYKHYIEAAQQLERYFQSVKDDLLNASDNLDDETLKGVTASTMTRHSYATGYDEEDITVERIC